MISDAKTALHYFLKGFAILSHKGLRRFAILPSLISFLFFVVIFSWGWHYMAELMGSLNHHLPSWLYWLDYIFWLLVLSMYSLIFVYCFAFFTNICGAPFNSFLCEKLLRLKSDNPPADLSFKEILKTIPKSLKRQLKMLLLLVGGGLILFILFWIPVIGLVAPILWFLLLSWFMTLQYLDYAADIRQKSVADIRAFMRQRPMLSLLFGMLVMGATILPLINLFIMPAAVCGATLLWEKEANS